MTKARRIEHGVKRPEPVEIEIDGRRIAAFPGESLAAALLAEGVTAFRRTASGAPRGPFCNMGICFECLVTVDGKRWQRACMTRVREGMRAETGDSEPR